MPRKWNTAGEIVNEKLLNNKLFRKLKVESQILANTPRGGYVFAMEIVFPTKGPYSKLTEKQVEPFRRQLEKDIQGLQRVLRVRN
jgi:hypothetical protein